MKKKLNINDLAKEIGVSKTTVSFVINGRGDEKNISKKTQDKIFAYIEKLGYRPNFMAQNLKKGKSLTIAYLVPDIANPFFANIGRLIEDKLATLGYHIIIGSTDESSEKESELINRLYDRQIDGFILASADITQTVISDLIKKKFPMVFFDRDNTNIEANYVVVENYLSMSKAVSELIDRGKKKIGLCTFSPDVQPLKHRIEGFKDAIISRGISFEEELIRIINPKKIKTSIHEEMSYLFSQNVDGIVFTNNQMATMGLWHLNMHFKDKIQNLGLATFDDIDYFDYSTPPIISIAQPVEEIANTVVENLHQMLNGKNLKPKRKVLQPKIIIRE